MARRMLPPPASGPAEPGDQPRGSILAGPPLPSRSSLVHQQQVLRDATHYLDCAACLFGSDTRGPWPSMAGALFVAQGVHGATSIKEGSLKTLLRGETRGKWPLSR